ncbi:GTPase Era [Desulfocurvus vexinensis]|uniref:GTPase Era n=1 Tax=Desulfocurvus vexinensis TaxID=399548 RepID=UPI00048F56FB|nr:GTPase Era [Desulfocurvus vexinensis]
MTTQQNPFRFGTVALLGPPNAGKSTLLNTVLGQKVAIVTPKPQTTRNQITGILTDEGAQIVFLDTPGVHRMKGRLNRFLNLSAWQAVEQADAVVVLADAGLYAKKPALLDKELAPLVEGVRRLAQPVFVAVNKIDQVRDKAGLLPVMQALGALWPQAEVFPVSAASGQGVPELLGAVRAVLPEGQAMFPEDQLSTLPLRFLAAEAIREQLFLALRQELPYSVAVEIEQWEEIDGLTRIGGLIWVGRDSHKAMVIGKGGQTLKAVGQAARQELKALVGGKVHLELWAKVRRDWTEDPHFLRGLGLGE